MSRRALQAVNLLLALGTIVISGLSFLFGVDSPVYGNVEIPAFAALDSNLGFMGGMGLGLGIALLWVTPGIERQTVVFRVVWLCALLGGIGRLISLAAVGAPPLGLTIFTVIEIAGVPALIYWQALLARSAYSGQFIMPTERGCPGAA